MVELSATEPVEEVEVFLQRIGSDIGFFVSDGSGEIGQGEEVVLLKGKCCDIVVSVFIGQTDDLPDVCFLTGEIDGEMGAPLLHRKKEIELVAGGAVVANSYGCLYGGSERVGRVGYGSDAAQPTASAEERRIGLPCYVDGIADGDKP